MKKLAMLLAASVFLAGCPNPGNGTSTPNAAGKTPGKFSATVLSDAIGSNAARSVSLGTFTISNSKSIYFILRNVGDFPITGITITAGALNANGGVFQPLPDNGVMASPGAIPVLETSGKASVETVIEVDINHGDVIGLISQQYIHQSDFAGATVRIAGKMTDEKGTAIDISLDLDIQTLIKVCSFEVHYSIDNGTTYKKAEYDFPPYTWADEPFYLIPYAGRNYIKIVNTGNVPLRYKVWKNSENAQTWENYNEWVNLNAGAYSSILSYRDASIDGGGVNRFLIDTMGVAFDNGGIESLVFRPNSSIVIDGFNPNSYVTGLPFFIFWREE